MGINVSEIQDKTLLKYAQKVDDGDGNLNEQEMNSLFENLNLESSNIKDRTNDRSIVGIAAYELGLAGIMTGGLKGMSLLPKVKSGLAKPNIVSKVFKFAASAKGFAFLAATGVAAALISNKILQNKDAKLDAAITEFNQLRTQMA